MSIFTNMKDMMSMAAKAKEIQGNIKKAQADIQKYSTTCSDPSHQVEVSITGEFHITRVVIKPDCPALKDRVLLEECVMDATNNAIHNLKSYIKTRMEEATGGMDIPGLLN